VLLTGRAYGHRATLELTGDTLTWRAQRGTPPVAENIATTPHDVQAARLVVRRWSIPGFLISSISVMWMASESALVGAIPLAVGLALIVARQLRPLRHLALDLGDRTLVLRVAPGLADDARTLVDRVARRELPASPPTLP
jgi:hypothetical protein